MKGFKHLLITLLLLPSFTGNAQWVELNTITGRTIETLNFLDADLGYALMKNPSTSIYSLNKTSDGGESWTSVDLPFSIPEFQDIHFYAEGQGVILFRDLSDATVPTKIFRTVDDGANWQDISPEMTAVGVGSGKCQFLDQNIGFFAAEKSLYITQDGGTEWTVKEFDNYIISLDFLDAEHGTLGTWDGTFAYKGSMLTTSDGGENWTENLLDDEYSSIGKVQRLSNDLSFAAPVDSWASQLSKNAFKTTDGGMTWDSITIPQLVDNDRVRQIHFRNEMVGVICIGDWNTTVIYQTTDGGETWEETGTFLSNGETDIQLIDNTGYITGDVGSFYKNSQLTATKNLLKNTEVKLFPSPAKSGQIINWISDENFSTLSILNSAGQKIHQQEVDQSNAFLPSLSAGLYFVRLSNDKVESIKKLYVE